MWLVLSPPEFSKLVYVVDPHSVFGQKYGILSSGQIFGCILCPWTHPTPLQYLPLKHKA